MGQQVEFSDGCFLNGEFVPLLTNMLHALDDTPHAAFAVLVRIQAYSRKT